MWPWELALHLLVEPDSGFMVLAVWAMPVAAGKIKKVSGVAFFTLEYGDTTTLCFALHDVLNHLFVYGWHGMLIAGKVLGSVCMDNIFNDTHAQVLP